VQDFTRIDHIISRVDLVVAFDSFIKISYRFEMIRFHAWYEIVFACFAVLSKGFIVAIMVNIRNCKATSNVVLEGIQDSLHLDC
jgi:hypothetical protein